MIGLKHAPIPEIGSCFHFVHHALDFAVVSVVPCCAIIGCKKSAIVLDYVLELSETTTLKGKVVKGLIIIDPKGNVPSLPIFPTVH